MCYFPYTNVFQWVNDENYDAADLLWYGIVKDTYDNSDYVYWENFCANKICFEYNTTFVPSSAPTMVPSINPTDAPSQNPTDAPSQNPTTYKKKSPKIFWEKSKNEKNAKMRKMRFYNFFVHKCTYINTN